MIGVKYLFLVVCSSLSRGKAKVMIGNGNVFVTNHVLAGSSIERTFDATSICMCKSICLTLPSCSTASFSPSTKYKNCFISSLALHDVQLEDVEGAKIIAKVSTFKYFFGDDGWFYTYYIGTFSNSEISTKCQGLSNGRMVILKTLVQLTSFRKFYEAEFNPPDGGLSWMNIGLVMNTTGLYWEDGSPFDESLYPDKLIVKRNGMENYGIAAYYYNDYYKIEGSSGSYAMCQFRP